MFHTAQDHIVKREKRRRIYHRCQYNTVAVFSWGETLEFTKSWIVCHLYISFHVCQYSGCCTISKCLLSRLYSECDYLFGEFILEEMAESTTNPGIECLNWIECIKSINKLCSNFNAINTMFQQIFAKQTTSSHLPSMICYNWRSLFALFAIKKGKTVQCTDFKKT